MPSTERKEFTPEEREQLKDRGFQESEIDKVSVIDFQNSHIKGQYIKLQDRSNIV